MSEVTKESLAFRLVDHHGICVLPFGFDQRSKPGGRFEKSPRWGRSTFRLDDPVDAERTGYFLPYIRRFLFPTRTDDADGDVAESTCRRFLFDLQSIGGTLDGLTGTLRGHDNQDNLPFECEVSLWRVELILFPFEVGFLLLSFSCEDARATYTDQMKSLGMLRMLAPWFADQPLPTWEVGDKKFQMPQLIANLLAELSGPVDAAIPLPAEPDPKARLPFKLIHDDRMMVYAFSCIDHHTCPQDIREAEKILRKRALVNFGRDSAKSAENARERGLRSWLRVRWEGFAKDGGLLVAFDMDEFDRKYLGLYHRTYYFDVFLLAVLQRVTLLMLYERLSDIPELTTGGSKGRRILRRLRHDLLLFKNQCCFSQITLRERGLVLWKKWQETFENDTLLREVNDQSQELENYLRSQYRDRMEWIVRLGGFLATTVPLVLGLEVLFGEAEWVSNLRWGLLVALVVGTGLAASWILFRKPKMS